MMGEYMGGFEQYELLISDHLPVLLSFQMLDYTYVNLITKLFFHYSTFYASIFLFFSSPLIAQEYKDLESMLMDLKPYVDEIQNGYLKVEYDKERIAKISWLDQDSTEFSRVFHYNGDDLSLITEFREKSILKEFHFNSHSVTGRFIEFLSEFSISDDT